MNFDYFDPAVLSAISNFILVPTLVIASLVALRVIFSSRPALGITNVMFYFMLPAYLGFWVVLSLCPLNKGFCSIIGIAPSIIFKPAIVLGLLLGMIAPAPSFVLGPPIGLALGAIFRGLMSSFNDK